MKKRKITLTIVLFVIININLLFSLGLVSADNMRMGIQVGLNDFNTEFYFEDEPEAIVGFNGYDLEVPDHPTTPYSEFYSVINDGGEKHLILDSWNATGEYKSRTLNLVYHATANYSGTLELSWSPSDISSGYMVDLKDYGSDSSYSSENLVSSVSLNSENSYSVSNSNSKRYFQLETYAYYCGDGIVNSSIGEQCESSQLNGQTCTSLGHPNGDLSCDSSCQYDVSGCYTCGDGTVTSIAGEECDCGNPWDCASGDDDNLDSETCSTQGFSTGSLSCYSSNCSLDTSSCSYTSPQNSDDSTSSGSPGGGGGGTSSDCTDECSSDEAVCLNGSYFKQKVCADFDEDSCLEFNNWSFIQCNTDEICYNAACIPRNTEGKEELTCEKLEYECGEHSIYGNTILCGYCELGNQCSSGRCVPSEDYNLTFYDNFMRFLDLRKPLWFVGRKFMYRLELNTLNYI